MSIPSVALVLHPNFSPFHFSVPYMVFSISLSDIRLFDLKIVSSDGKSQQAERAMTVQPDGGVELLETADIVIIPSWDELNEPPDPVLTDAIIRAHKRNAHIVGLCYGAYALAYTGLLNGKKAVTHWLAEQDFCLRFPEVKLDTNALYVEEDRVITSAGTAAGLDCCLYIVREYYGSQTANKIARLMVVPPHREGGQAQFIEQPIASSTRDAKINHLLDYLRKNLVKQHSIDELAAQTLMSRRSFTRHFAKATHMTVKEWIINERLQRSLELLESTSQSIENVAEIVGFQTATSFRQHFTKRYSVSPRAWRKTFGGG
ncbi:GlxA family transcriptional regulator [Neisseria sp. Ec49-e6-T10]|uniref:GlxA family transcriptional regulator n=1 Tax=Neisseria sp. Ec49-e6-T10 TaxID=3140744 RepID=UPI003EBC3D41